MGGIEMVNWLIILAVIAVGSICAACFYAFSSYRLMHRLETLMHAFIEKGKAEDFSMGESRESKFESQLRQVLHRAQESEKQAFDERDKVSVLLSDLSHQLKTPLANVVMYTEILQAGGVSKEEQDVFLKETRNQTKKMEWLMDAMLKASQLERGSVVFSAEYAGIRETIGNAVGSVYARAVEKEITIITEEFEECRLYHDPKWTVEALGNILDNAVKYSPKASQITVRLYPLEIYTCIEIEDQGVGIESTEYNEIFKRFYRGNRTRQKEGSGLGLYLSQLILNQEKGYVTVHSRPGQGSCFQVYLLNEVRA